MTSLICHRQHSQDGLQERQPSWRVTFYPSRKCDGSSSPAFLSNFGPQALLPLPQLPTGLPQSLRWQPANGLNLYLFHDLIEDESVSRQSAGCIDLRSPAIQHTPLVPFINIAQIQAFAVNP